MSTLWSTFSTQKTLKKKIENHHQKIKWQIRRIYRTRNQIMHSGACSSDIRQLIQHLHSYYILTIHNLIHDLKENKGWAIKDALEYRKSLYSYFIKRLEEAGKHQPISIEMILKPQLTLSQKAEHPAWANLSAKELEK